MHKEKRGEDTESREGAIFGSLSRDTGLVPIRPEEWNQIRTSQKEHAELIPLQRCAPPIYLSSHSKHFIISHDSSLIIIWPLVLPVIVTLPASRQETCSVVGPRVRDATSNH
jgi:hypothetical protein